MLIFTYFWEVFFSKRAPPFPGGAQILQRMAVPTSWIFWLTRKRRAGVGRGRADVGQTSGRQARRARNVGQTSGTSGELKVVQIGKNHLQRIRGGKIEKKGTCPVMPKILYTQNLKMLGGSFGKIFGPEKGKDPNFVLAELQKWAP